MPRHSWREQRRAHRGPVWRLAVYHAARGAALLLLWAPVMAGKLVGAAAGWADDAITTRLTRVEGWSHPGLYAELVNPAGYLRGLRRALGRTTTTGPPPDPELCPMDLGAPRCAECPYWPICQRASDYWWNDPAYRPADWADQVELARADPPWSAINRGGG